MQLILSPQLIISKAGSVMSCRIREINVLRSDISMEIRLCFCSVWQPKPYLVFDLSFIQPDSAVSVKTINSEEQLQSAGLSLLLLPVPGGNPVRKEPTEEACTGFSFWRFWSFWALPPSFTAALAHRHFARFSGRPGPSMRTLRVVPRLPRWSPDRHDIYDISWKSFSGLRKNWMVNMHRSSSDTLNLAGNIKKMCISYFPIDWRINGRNGGENPPYIFLVAGLWAVFLLSVAVLPTLTPVFDCMTLGELCIRLTLMVWPWQMAAEHRRKCNGALQASVIYLVLRQKICCAPLPCKNPQMTVKFWFYRYRVGLFYT